MGQEEAYEVGTAVTRVRTVDNPRHPSHFSTARKAHIVLVGLICVFNGNLGSSLPSGAVESLAAYFSIPTGSTLLVLPNSLYLVGYTISPLFMGPLSETFGRRPIMVGSFMFYILFTLCCAVSPTFTGLLVCRVLAGVCAAVPNAVNSGLYGDIFPNPRQRGQAIATFMLFGAQGPLAGPLVSGYVSVNLGWRWVFWVGVIIAGAMSPVVLLLPETYFPVLEEKLREREHEGERVEGRIGMVAQKVGGSLKRPFLMMVKEPLLSLTSLYLALVYALQYMFFQAYPVIFRGIYGLQIDEIGLSYIPIMFGVVVAFGIFSWFGWYHERALAAGKPWAGVPELRRLPLACFGGPLLPIALLIQGFTARDSVHPAIPMVVPGVLFGIGYSTVFLAMIIYLADVYKKYAASAQAASSTARSLLAVCLPFAAPSMYGNLGVKWASVVFAVLSALMALIPFAFVVFRKHLQARSAFAG
ncbi:Efflux pump-like protein 2 [Elsinoe fawcettii]|nr:Efflux pump-like protein 2 [Elsinoe fawcettii]